MSALGNGKPLGRVSIRAPIRGPGRPGRSWWARWWARRFNPRPDPRTGATCRPWATASPWAGFQSAPRSEDRGDTNGVAATSWFSLFQSAPRSEDRGDPMYRLTAVRPSSMFQSAPRSEDRGDLGRGSAAGAYLPVSIRAPIRGPGRRIQEPSSIASTEFQSAPRSEDRGDLCQHNHSHHQTTRFNPRPDPRTGATYVNIIIHTIKQHVSIRAPIRGPGRRATYRHALSRYAVSIRAPIRGPGRRSRNGSS